MSLRSECLDISIHLIRPTEKTWNNRTTSIDKRMTFDVCASLCSVTQTSNMFLTNCTEESFPDHLGRPPSGAPLSRGVLWAAGGGQSQGHGGYHRAAVVGSEAVVKELKLKTSGVLNIAGKTKT